MTRKNNFLFFFFFFGCTAQHMVSLFSDQDLKPCPLQWKHGVLTTGPPGKSQEKNNFKRNKQKNGFCLEVYRISWEVYTTNSVYINRIRKTVISTQIIKEITDNPHMFLWQLSEKEQDFEIFTLNDDLEKKNQVDVQLDGNLGRQIGVNIFDKNY